MKLHTISPVDNLISYVSNTSGKPSPIVLTQIIKRLQNEKMGKGFLCGFRGKVFIIAYHNKYLIIAP